jgi:hypothetical protein
MTWFQSLTGFPEATPGAVRKNIAVEGELMTSLANGRVMACGRLETPSLGELRQRVRQSEPVGGSISVSEVVANVQELHVDAANTGALFQVASQFNLLEMASPEATPELGVGIYEQDYTQGPACAVACGAGTIYRNYFVPVRGRTGQSVGNQIDCLAGLGQALGNTANRLWQMQNGYALASRSGLIEISKRLEDSSEEELDQLRSLLRIGVQWDTEVTLSNAGHRVTQAYCSALPVAYSNLPTLLWKAFACLVLEAAYEATLCTAILNWQRTGNRMVYLTLLGGGAFGNENDWIINALRRALKLYQKWPVDAAIVSYGGSKLHVRQLAEEFAA